MSIHKEIIGENNIVRFYSLLLGALVSLPLANQASAEDYPAGDAVAGAKVFKNVNPVTLLAPGQKMCRPPSQQYYR